MVCIIDDREDVWSHATNLIHVKPYHFFQHTGDINAPPGLDKHEDDNKSGVDLTKAVVKNNNNEKMEDKPPDVKDDTDSGANEKEKDVKDEDVDVVPDDRDIENKDKEEKDGQDKGEKEEGKGLEEEKSAEDEEKGNETDAGEASEAQDKNVENSLLNSQNTNSSSNEQSASDKILEDSAVIPEKPVQMETELDSKEINGNVESQEKSIRQNSENSKLVDTIEDEVAQETKDPAANENDVAQSTEEPVEELLFIPMLNHENYLIEVEDPDDYLIYLEDILKRIHKEFYDQFDKLESGEIPDLKQVIPRVRNNVLQGCHLVFSGLVPTHIKLEQSKAYQVARSLGATVTQDLEDDTTHLVAVRPGTAKVNAGRRKRNLKLVTPDWLWCCAER